MSDEKLDIDVNKIICHLIDTSDEDFRTMLSLYDSKSYGWALFLGHISIEKLLKANYVRKHRKHAPFTHNLFRLAELGEIEMTDEQSDWLDRITSFNLNARYDDYKREFYSLCTSDFTLDWIEKIEILRSWIKQLF
jgi:HEPN domain-containing protein